MGPARTGELFFGESSSKANELQQSTATLVSDFDFALSSGAALTRCQARGANTVAATERDSARPFAELRPHSGARGQREGGLGLLDTKRRTIGSEIEYRFSELVMRPEEVSSPKTL